MGANLTTQGFGELFDQLNLMVEKEAADQTINKILQKAVEPIQKDAMQTTAFTDRNKNPNKQLRNNIKISKVAKKRAGYRVIKVYCAKREASLVEFGHSGKYARPHPFLAPAYERHEDEAAQIIYDGIKEALLSR